MELSNEITETVHRFDVDMTEKEREVFVRHAEKNMSKDERESMLINWSLIDIIKKSIDAAESEQSFSEEV
jgi:hypothetical protein